MNIHPTKFVIIPIGPSGTGIGQLEAAVEGMRAKGFCSDRLQWRMCPAALHRLRDNWIVSQTVAHTARTIEDSSRLLGIEVTCTPHMPAGEIRLESR